MSEFGNVRDLISVSVLITQFNLKLGMIFVFFFRFFQFVVVFSFSGERHLILQNLCFGMCTHGIVVCERC